MIALLHTPSDPGQSPGKSCLATSCDALHASDLTHSLTEAAERRSAPLVEFLIGTERVMQNDADDTSQSRTKSAQQARPGAGDMGQRDVGRAAALPGRAGWRAELHARRCGATAQVPSPTPQSPTRPCGT